MTSKETLFWSSLRVITAETKPKSDKEQQSDRVLELYDKALMEFPARLEKAIQNGRARVAIITYTDSIGREAADLLSKLLTSRGIRITVASLFPSTAYRTLNQVYVEIADIYPVVERM